MVVGAQSCLLVTQGVVEIFLQSVDTDLEFHVCFAKLSAIIVRNNACRIVGRT